MVFCCAICGCSRHTLGIHVAPFSIGHMGHRTWAVWTTVGPAHFLLPLDNLGQFRRRRSYGFRWKLYLVLHLVLHPRCSGCRHTLLRSLTKLETSSLYTAMRPLLPHQVKQTGSLFLLSIGSGSIFTCFLSNQSLTMSFIHKRILQFILPNFSSIARTALECHHNYALHINSLPYKSFSLFYPIYTILDL